MKRVGIFLFCLLFVAFFGLTLSAEEPWQGGISVPSEIAEYLPSDAFDMDLAAAGEAFNFGFFTRVGIKILSAAVPDATRSFAKLLGLLLLSAVLRAFGETLGSAEVKTVVSLVSALCLCGAVFSVTETVFSLSEQFIKTVSGFLASLTPAMAAMMLATGNVSSSAVTSGVMTAALAVLETVTSGVLFPLIRISLCLSVVSSVFRMEGVGALMPLMKKVIVLVFGAVTLCLSAVLAFQGIIGKSADSVAVKGIKFAVGSFVPIVGGAVNEALATVAGGVGAIKAVTGVVGAVAVVLIAALPMARILIYKLFLELLGAVSGILGMQTEGKLIAETSSFLGYGAAMMAISAVFFILTLSVMAAIRL